MSTITESISSESQKDPQLACRLVTCQAGSLDFAIDADCISGVYQLTDKNADAEIEEFETPQGIVPVMRLSEVIMHHLEIELPNLEEERSLIAIQVGDEAAALRTGVVSQPITLSDSRLYSVPHIARPTDQQTIVTAIAVIDDTTDNPRDALRLLIDPARALGFIDAPIFDTLAEASWIDPSDTQKVTNQRENCQLLTFVPELVVGPQPEFEFCLPLATLAEITAALPIMEIPSSSPLLLGYVLWRRTPVPIIDMAAAFCLHEPGLILQSPRHTNRMVIARIDGNRLVGFFTQSEINRVKNPPAASEIEIDAIQGRPYLGAFETEHGRLVVPDLKSILDLSDLCCK